MTEHTGSCRCGQLRVLAKGDPVRVSICHCLACQKRTGSVFSAQARWPSECVTTEGESKQWTRTADSGQTTVYNFCPDCGSRVFSTNLESFPGAVFATLGCIDNPAGIEPVLEMFVKRRLKWVAPLPLPQFQDMPH